MLMVARSHLRCLSKGPVRIHVAGSRGKTSTARLIGAGLAAAGHRVVVKITGTEPLVVLPDGGAAVWPRPGPPSIAELTRLFREAAARTAEMAVSQSLAIEPAFPWALDSCLRRATPSLVHTITPYPAGGG